MISIIIPLYNKQNCIERAIKSVLSQTFTDFELLVINDGSTDQSDEIVKEIKDNRLILINKQNGGVSTARNKGVDAAKGEWIIFLDADDYFLPTCIDTLYKTAITYKVNVAAANFYIEINGKKKLACYGNKEKIIRNNFAAWYLGLFCPRTGAAIFRRELLLKYSFREDLQRYEDAESLFNIMRNNLIAYTPVPVMSYTQDYNHLSKLHNNLSKDYIGCLIFDNKSFSEKLLLTSLLEQGFCIYPSKTKYLKLKYKHFLYLLPINKSITFVIRCLRKIKLLGIFNIFF